MSTDYREMPRRLRNAVEPVAAGVYFAPEAHAAYAALGFACSPAAADGVARPELKSYFTSRGACLGQVSGEVVAAAFGCSTPRSLSRPWRPGGRSPAGRPSSAPASGARPRCCNECSVIDPTAWLGPPISCAAPRRRPRGRPARCMEGCGRWASPTIR
jgi:helix-turn-helix protein